MPNDNKHALDGVRVLDVSNVLAAPVTATMLGDFGADVVKVESPVTGDFTRRRAKTVGGRSLEWVQEARNKRSVTLDLHNPKGRDLLQQLIPHFDVLVTNFRPPTLERFQLDPPHVQRLHPDIIAVYITGYGLTGPYRDRGAFDRVASAYAGLTYVSGYPDLPPVRTGYAVIDYMTAYLAAYSVAIALYHRDVHNGPGQIIDLALYEAGFRASEGALLQYAQHGTIRERLGNRSPHVVPASDFAAADGVRIAIHAGTASLFQRLTEAMGEPELYTDDRFSTFEARVNNQDLLYDRIARWVGTLTGNDVITKLNAAGIPAAAIMSIADIAQDSHYLERGTIINWNDPEYGHLLMASPLPHMSATPGEVRSAGPTLGAHNQEIYQGLLGLSDTDFATLHTDGVI